MYDDSFKLRYRNAPIAIYENITSTDTKAHIHSEIEILYIEKGRAQINVAEEQFAVAEGDLVFINPLEVHSIKVCTDNEYLHKCICFDTTLVADEKIREALLNGKTAIARYLPSGDNGELKSLFVKLYSAVEKNDDGLLFESTAYISLMFTFLIRNGFLSDSVKTEKNAEFCKAVIKYITENYGSDISSKDIAEKLFYTQSYFCRNFSKNFSVPFSKYLNMYRISRAKNMLQSTELKISDISGACGFYSPEYFTKCFKREFGISPQKYRKGQYSTEKQ